jgi:hypothetical protein
MNVMPNEDEINRIVDSWIAYHLAAKGSSERDEHWWAVEKEMDWMAESEAAMLWKFIRVAYQRELPETVVASLAAGPLENLLADNGSEHIDRIEELARQDPKFNYLLGGVWKGGMANEIWERVQAIRNHVW